jgi:hypothetical protein
MRELPDWINDFVLKSFGGYEVMNQQDFVQRQKQEESLNQQNTINEGYKDSDEKSNAIGINDQTGDKFEVVVNKVNKDKKDVGMRVEFSSGVNKDKYICSSLSDFCGGRYANLEGFPLEMVASTIAKDHSYIVNFIETSIASNSDSITIETALDITKKITKNSSIDKGDHKKICSKLNNDDLTIYNIYLANAGIKITDATVADKVSDLGYYMNYIRNFKEYVLAADDKEKGLPLLKARIASIEKFSALKDALADEFKKDTVLCNIEFGDNNV